MHPQERQHSADARRKSGTECPPARSTDPFARGIKARRAETALGGSVHESPTGGAGRAL